MIYSALFLISHCDLFLLFLFFILGLVVGSFLNVVIFRLEKEEGGILTGRSHCPLCGQTLKWFELIPLVSFLLQRGRCRYCKKPISWVYPLVELATASIFVSLFLKFGLTAQLLFWLGISACLIILFVTDLRTQTVYDLICYIAIAFALARLVYWYFAFENHLFIWAALEGALVAGAFFGLLVLLSHETWMGQGDIFLGVLAGLTLGYPKVLIALFLAFLLGALVGGFLLIFKKKGWRSEVPFGPFLVSAIFLTLFLGNPILKWYLGLFYGLI